MAEKVKVFSTPNCTQCDRVKKFLTEKGVQFDTFDVTRDMNAFQEMRSISRGARAAPVISICDKVLVGFNKDELERAMSCL